LATFFKGAFWAAGKQPMAAKASDKITIKNIENLYIEVIL